MGVAMGILTKMGRLGAILPERTDETAARASAHEQHLLQRRAPVDATEIRDREQARSRRSTLNRVTEVKTPRRIKDRATIR